MRAGDVLIGVASSGVHSNGYSLVRKVVDLTGLGLDAPAPFSAGAKLGEALLTPTRLYVKSALAAIRRGGVKGLAHITGGGITGNLPRALPVGLDAEVDLAAWKLPRVFQWLAREAGLPEAEMLRTFNCGIGLIVVADAAKAADIIGAFEEAGEQAFPIGALVPAGGPEPEVRYRGRLLP
jgi:phosphoribosylformylglycinamidine cyclo-ligase